MGNYVPKLKFYKYSLKQKYKKPNIMIIRESKFKD